MISSEYVDTDPAEVIDHDSTPPGKYFTNIIPGSHGRGVEFGPAVAVFAKVILRNGDLLGCRQFPSREIFKLMQPNTSHVSV
jgi:hypothetical protein